MKDYRVLYEVVATGKRKVAKLGENIQTEEDARKAMQIRYGDHIQILEVVDVNDPN